MSGMPLRESGFSIMCHRTHTGICSHIVEIIKLRVSRSWPHFISAEQWGRTLQTANSRVYDGLEIFLRLSRDCNKSQRSRQKIWIYFRPRLKITSINEAMYATYS